MLNKKTIIILLTIIFYQSPLLSQSSSFNDFKSTNLFSISKALSKFGIIKKITIPKHFENIDLLVIPGVGTFSSSMEFLRKKKLEKKIINHANSGKKVIGICLGMQLLLDHGTETRKTKGISLIKGKVHKFGKKNS